MPRKAKSQQKSKEEITAEQYFPVDETSLKRSVEKSIRQIDPLSLETIEKPGTKRKITRKTTGKTTKTKSRTTRKTTKKTTKKTNSRIKKVEFKAPDIKLKKDGYELIVTEKPQAAAKISEFLGKAVKRDVKKIPYYEIDRNGHKIVVVCAVGHLFTLTQNASRASLPNFDISWVPNFQARKNDFTKKYYDVIASLAKKAGSVTIATDYDTEGEVIGMNVMRFICGQNNASRMKFSTLTNKEINDAYENKFSTINWGQAVAGETRHYLDWFYGINLSRALMNAIKSTGRFRIMSIGRVQGPALNLIVKKEKSISKFKPETYWQIYATTNEYPQVELKHNKDIFNESELSKFDGLIGKKGQAETTKKQQSLSPNPPFDLTSLQTEAYRLYGITPSKTLQIAQSLYLAGLISYPRTSSQKLPDSIGYKEILKKLAKKYNVESLIKNAKPIEGKKSDPAHPSIYPTGNLQILSGQEEKIYNLIVKRFLCLFCEPALIDNKKINLDVEKLKFSTRGVEIKRKAWLEIYPYKINENSVPDINGEVEIKNIKKEEKETQPPKRYSQASIITELEKKHLGTKATRANIIETLYDRGYVKDKSIEATPLGIALIDSLEKHSPIIIDEKLTRNFEDSMENIRNLKSNYVNKEEEILDKAKNSITKIVDQFKEQEKDIGNELLQANEKLREIQREENTLNVCPKCQKGQLTITYSKKTRRHFVACNKYPDCKNTYSLPPDALIKRTDKICEHCGFRILMSLKKGKKPWFFCFNPECPSNKERLEEYRRKKAEESN